MYSIEKLPEKIRINNQKTPKKHVKRMTSRALRAARKQLINKYLAADAREQEEYLYGVVIP